MSERGYFAGPKKAGELDAPPLPRDSLGRIDADEYERRLGHDIDHLRVTLADSLYFALAATDDCGSPLEHCGADECKRCDYVQSFRLANDALAVIARRLGVA